MCNHDEYIETREELAIKLRRDPTANEIENAIADRVAKGIDTAYEQARADRRIIFS